jgi:hypothetical protein
MAESIAMKISLGDFRQWWRKFRANDLAERKLRRDQQYASFPTTYVDKSVVFVAESATLSGPDG